MHGVRSRCEFTHLFVYFFHFLSFHFFFCKMSTTFMSLHKNEINCSVDIGVEMEKITHLVRAYVCDKTILCLMVFCFSIFISFHLVRCLATGNMRVQYLSQVNNDQIEEKKTKDRIEMLFSLCQLIFVAVFISSSCFFLSLSLT